MSINGSIVCIDEQTSLIIVHIYTHGEHNYYLTETPEETTLTMYSNYDDFPNLSDIINAAELSRYVYYIIENNYLL